MNRPPPERPVQRASPGDSVLEELRTLCLALPETSERSSWGHPNFLAGNKTFVTFEHFQRRPSIAFRLDGGDIERYAKNGNFFATPYGRGQWLSMWVDATFDWDLTRDLVMSSYRSVALKRMIVALGTMT